jgi:iron complex outermembrane recepter protein
MNIPPKQLKPAVRPRQGAPAPRRWQSSLIGAAALLTIRAVHAQEQAPEPEVAFTLQRVVTHTFAVGNLQSRHLLTSVDALGSESLQDAAINHNWELFGRLPGVQLTNYNQGTISGRPSMRGFNGEGMVSAVKLLIDGVPSNTNDGAMPYMDLVTPLGLEGITAVRGTNDARYGLHSIAGNLEMITREGGNATDLRVGAGPWGRRDAQLAVDREEGGVTQNYALGVRHTDGWRDHGKSEQASMAGRWGYAPRGRKLRFGLAVRAHSARAEEPGFLTAADAYAEPRRSHAVSATDGGERRMGQASFSVDGHEAALSWRGLVYVNRFDDTRFVRFSAGVSQQERVTDETHRGARFIVSWRPRVDALPGFALEGGVDAERQRNASQRYATAARIRSSQTRDQAWTFNTMGAFVQAIFKPLPTVKLVPGLRVDRIGGYFSDRRSGAEAGINDYGSIRQPKISAVWSPTEAISAYANWGRTFQVGIGAASYKIPPRTADLQPSFNDGAELGLTWRAGTLADARLAVWQQTATDEVHRDTNNPNGGSINVGATRRRGADLQLRVSPSAAIGAYAALAIQKAMITRANPAEPASLGREVDHVPRHLYNLGVDWRARPDLKLSAWLQGAGSYWLERTNALTGKYGRYRTLNLGASWTASPLIRFDAQLLNAGSGQREYVWWDGTQTLHSPGEPRSLQLALRASF